MNKKERNWFFNSCNEIKMWSIFLFRTSQARNWGNKIHDSIYLWILSIMARSRNLQSHKGSLSKDVFERRTSTGSEAFSLFIYLGANKFVLLSFFSLIKTIYRRVSTKPLPNDAKSPLPVDFRRSKTPLLKLPNETLLTRFRIQIYVTRNC